MWTGVHPPAAGGGAEAPGDPAAAAASRAGHASGERRHSHTDLHTNQTAAVQPFVLPEHHNTLEMREHSSGLK